MSEYVIWHNPRCSKSRTALQLLRERGIEPRVVEYLREPPSADELRRVLDLLELQPAELLRGKDAREHGVDPSVGADALIGAMAAHPAVIERPVVIRGDRAVVGRPPERVLALLDGEDAA